MSVQQRKIFISVQSGTSASRSNFQSDRCAPARSLLGDSYLDAVSDQVGDVLLAAALQSVKEEVTVLLHLKTKWENGMGYE